MAAQAKVFERLSWAKLHNLYGPTEAAIDVTHWTCRGEERGRVPIGRPITATRVVVLDGALSAVAAGAVGELYLGGAGLARGYLNRCGLTADRFIADPFSEDGERLYRTGDLVRWSRDGQLEYLGRSDHQVKVRGYRIELGEIEAQLRTQPQVQEAVILFREGPSGPRLVGYVVAREAEQIDSTVIREQLGKTLPDYMVPSAIVVLDRLPLNANGKWIARRCQNRSTSVRINTSLRRRGGGDARSDLAGGAGSRACRSARQLFRARRAFAARADRRCEAASEGIPRRGAQSVPTSGARRLRAGDHAGPAARRCRAGERNCLWLREHSAGNADARRSQCRGNKAHRVNSTGAVPRTFRTSIPWRRSRRASFITISWKRMRRVRDVASSELRQ